MSKTLVTERDETILWTNGTGSAVVSGQMVLVGTGLVGIAKVDIANTAKGAVFVRGVHSYTRLTGGSTAWTINIPIFFDIANNRLTKAVTADAVFAGISTEITVDGDTTGKILLNAPKPAAAKVADGATTTTMLTSLRAAGLVIAS